MPTKRIGAIMLLCLFVLALSLSQEKAQNDSEREAII